MPGDGRLVEACISIVVRHGTFLASFFNGRQIDVCRTVRHLAMFVESRSVARAIPALLGAVPMNDAAEVRTNGGSLVDLAIAVAVAGDFVQPAAEHGSAAGLDLLHGFYFAR